MININKSLLELDTEDNEMLKQKLSKLFELELEDSINNILIEDREEFLRKFQNRMKLVLQDLYGNECFKNKEFGLCFNSSYNTFASNILEAIYSDLISLIKKDIVKNTFFNKPNSLLSQYKANVSGNTTNTIAINLSNLNTSNISNNQKSLYEVGIINNMKAVSQFSNNNNSTTSPMYIMDSYIKHCKSDYCSKQIALHNCSKNGKLYIKKNLALKKVTNIVSDYVICEQCKVVYFSNSFNLKCYSCGEYYYTCIKKPQDYYPITWEKYHCQILINEPIRCIDCRSELFVSNDNILRDNYSSAYCLKCKKCIYNIEKIDWQCIICSSNFTSSIKIYNSLELKSYKIAIKEALVFNKTISKPYELPCCDYSIESLDFFHNKSCRGKLYSGVVKTAYSEIQMIVCGLCKTITKSDNFIWSCPICYKRFRFKIDKRVFSPGVLSEKEFTPSVLSSISAISSPIVNMKHYIDKPVINDSNRSKNEQENIPKVIQCHKQPEFKKPTIKQPEIGSIAKYFNLLNNTNITKNNSKTLIKPIDISCINDNTEGSKKAQSTFSSNDQFTLQKLKACQETTNSNTNTFASDTNENYKKSEILHIYKNSDRKKKIMSMGIRNNNDNDRKSPIRLLTEFNLKNKDKSNQKIDAIDNLSPLKYSYIKKKVTSKSKNMHDISTISNNNKEVNDIKIDSSSKRLNTDVPVLTDRSEGLCSKFTFSQNNKSKEANQNKDRKPSFSIVNISNNFNTISDEKPIIYSKNKIKNTKNSFNCNNTSNNFSSIHNNSITCNNYTDQKPIATPSKDSSLITLIKQKEKPHKTSSSTTNHNLVSPLNISSKSNFKPNPLLSMSNRNKILIENINVQNNNTPLIKEIIINVSLTQFNSCISPKTHLINDVKYFDIEDFTMIEKIGEGTYGTIYSVKDKNNNKYALKKIVASDENELECFKQEYSTMQKIKHPFILTIHGICLKGFDSDITNTSILYVLMDLAVSDWNKEIKSKKELNQLFTIQEIISVMYQISTALAFLQSCGISHRDIKPHNILKFSNGTYKLADFGEAKFFLEKTSSQFTLRGTELYMSPLLFYGLKTSKQDIAHDPVKSDVFSLGLCCLYAMFLKIDLLYVVRNSTSIDLLERNVMKLIDKDSRFSTKFKYDWVFKLLFKMLSFDEKTRIDFYVLCDELESHLEEVLIKLKH